MATDDKRSGDGGRRSKFGKSDRKPFKKRFDNDRDRKPFKKKFDGDGDRKPFKKRFDNDRDGDRKPFKKKFDGDRDRKPFKKRFDSDRDRKPFKKKFDGDGDRKPFKKRFDSDRDRKPFKKKFDGDGDRKPFKKRFDGDRDRKPFKKRFDNDRDGDRKPFKKRFDNDRDGDRKPFKKRFDNDRDGDKKPFKKRYEERGTRDEGGRERGDRDRKPFTKKFDGDRDRKPFRKKFDRDDDRKPYKKSFGDRETRHSKPDTRHQEDFKEQKKAFLNEEYASETGETRLNKYIAHAGVCSRREADELIKAGAVKVNGVVVTEMGYKVKPGDVVNFGGESLREERKVYLLLNKPKDVITTTDDPHGRDNVMMLVRKACKERIYPVGRLDRATTGVLLFTNDGELAKVLTHPKHQVPKMYHVVLDKSLTKFDFDAIQNGVRLDDGMIKADVIDYIGDGSNKREIGLEIHSGRNRVVRRMFEQLGYKVTKLDRVMFAGLTKKDTPRGTWRFLTEKEIGFLKMFRPKEEK